jgi:hypothetical protein
MALLVHHSWLLAVLGVLPENCSYTPLVLVDTVAVVEAVAMPGRVDIAAGHSISAEQKGQVGQVAAIASQEALLPMN